ncbi:hypothetical protein VNO80_30565 [Phaseolus coccineus]|uniref:Uncharacterized protein n=1 Tax=Phaseolus coccineus TaxID=3886 RepID=A0AAN9QG78_PHACN
MALLHVVVLCLWNQASNGVLDYVLCLDGWPLGRVVGVEHIPELVSFSMEYIKKSDAATQLKDGSLSIHASAMVKYSREPNNPTESCKARGADLRVHFKNTRETAFAIRKLSLVKARSQLSSKAKTSNIPSPWKNQSLYVILVPHRIDIVGKGRTRQEGVRDEFGNKQEVPSSTKWCLFLGFIGFVFVLLLDEVSYSVSN